MTPLLSARALTKQYGGRNGCRNAGRGDDSHVTADQVNH